MDKLRELEEYIKCDDVNNDELWDIYWKLKKSLDIPKHETVSDWEKRTGETYPDDGPVWSFYKYIMLNNKEEWEIEKWGDCKGWEWDSVKPCIVADHHGKPQ